MFWGMCRKGNVCTLSAGMQTNIAIVENNMGVPQKLKIEGPYDLAAPFLGIYLNEIK
jgi:hypothetical protein